MTQIILLVLCSTLLGKQASAQMSHSAEPKPGIERSLKVPFLYEQSGSGVFDLHYEIGRKFDPTKPTVLVIADGQQFYIRKGLIAPLQDELFGEGFNVVGILGRGSNETVAKELAPGNADFSWSRAYELLKSEEWIDDIESVRKDVVGPGGDVALYGRSGGGLLVHQYLAKYPLHVRSVFTQAAVNRFLDAELGLNSDSFWDEIGSYDQTLQTQLLGVLKRHSAEHDKIMLLLQRQNFFVPASEIQVGRSHLIHVLAEWDQKAIDAFCKQYQVDAILANLQTRDAATSVRVFELFAPMLAHKHRGASDRITPDTEVGMMFSRPLIALLNRGDIKMPSMDLEALYRVRADVYMLAGRFDHTADYRSQIALAAHYPKHRLLLLADDHDFLELRKTALYPQLVQSALADGIRGPEKQGIESKLAPLVYDEQ